MKRIEKIKTEKKQRLKLGESIQSDQDENIIENIEYLEEYLERLKKLEEIRLRKLEMLSVLSKSPLINFKRKDRRSKTKFGEQRTFSSRKFVYN